MKKKNGLNLLELIVVILVLASLIALLFFGARAWKRGQDAAMERVKKNVEESRCILNQHYFEDALIKYRACKDLGPGDSFNFEKVLVHEGMNPKNFICPQGGTYTFKEKIPPMGEPVLECSHVPHQYQKYTKK